MPEEYSATQFDDDPSPVTVGAASLIVDTGDEVVAHTVRASRVPRADGSDTSRFTS